MTMAMPSSITPPGEMRLDGAPHERTGQHQSSPRVAAPRRRPGVVEQQSDFSKDRRVPRSEDQFAGAVHLQATISNPLRFRHAFKHARQPVVMPAEDALVADKMLHAAEVVDHLRMRVIAVDQDQVIPCAFGGLVDILGEIPCLLRRIRQSSRTRSCSAVAKHR